MQGWKHDAGLLDGLDEFAERQAAVLTSAEWADSPSTLSLGESSPRG